MRTDEDLRELHDGSPDDDANAESFGQGVFQAGNIGDVQIFYQSFIACLQNTQCISSMKRMYNANMRTFPTMETPRSFMNHGKFFVIAVIVSLDTS